MREPSKATPFGDEQRKAQFPLNLVFNAHVVKFASTEFDDGNEVFNLTVKLAEDGLKDIKIPMVVYDNDLGEETEVKGEDGAPKIITCERWAGREFRVANGMWFYEKTKYDWQTNERYSDFCTGLGVEFPTKKVGKIEVPLLQKIDEEDVLGKPCKVKIGLYSFTVKEDQPDGSTKKVKRQALGVLNIMPWADGETIEVESDEEEAPF